MPPLEKRLPRVLAVAGFEHGRRGGHLVADPAAEIEDESMAKFKQETRRRRRWSRRLSKTRGRPSGELPEGVGVDGHQIQRLECKNKNIVLNTRNRFIIWLAKNELHISLAILAFVHACCWAGFEWPEKFISMQHQVTAAAAAVGGGTQGSEERFVRGIDDFKFVAYWIVQLVAIRSVLLHHVIPVIPKAMGVKSERKQRRFCEMGWNFSYITTLWCVGFRVWQASPYYMNTYSLYANYPEEHALMPYGLKWYYLVQMAFWYSNVYTIHIEERRKDHAEMLAHHITTIVLVSVSYMCHFTRFGHAFMLVMDFPDIFLSSAKMARYLNDELFSNVLFAIFSVSWVFTKHYLCLKMMFSIWIQGTAAIPQEKRYPHYPNSYASYPIVICLWVFLCILQVILVYWFYLVLLVLNRVLFKGENPDDNRSDEEDEDEPIESADADTHTDEKRLNASSADSGIGMKTKI